MNITDPLRQPWRPTPPTPGNRRVTSAPANEQSLHAAVADAAWPCRAV